LVIAHHRVPNTPKPSAHGQALLAAKARSPISLQAGIASISQYMKWVKEYLEDEN
jgi:hypothetical protein